MSVGVHVSRNEAAPSGEGQQAAEMGGYSNKEHELYRAPIAVSEHMHPQSRHHRGLLTARVRAWTINARATFTERSLCTDRQVLCRTDAAEPPNRRPQQDSGIAGCVSEPQGHMALHLRSEMFKIFV